MTYINYIRFSCNLNFDMTCRFDILLLFLYFFKSVYGQGGHKFSSHPLNIYNIQILRTNTQTHTRVRS